MPKPPAKKPKGKVALQEEGWFHGIISRENVKPLLTTIGDYLVRESAKKPGELALSVMAHDKLTHFIIQQDVPGKFRFEGDAYPSVRELVQHYRTCNLDVTKRSEAKLKRAICKRGFEDDFDEEEEPLDDGDEWMLRHSDITIGKRLGGGNFGDVVMGTMRATGVKVAVKTCKDTVPDPARFLEEAECLKDYDHPNIVKLVGVVSSKPIYIVLELCTGGELLDFLRKGGHDVAMHVKMSGEAADGMAYLHTKRCIHRDLAARNCLVTDEGKVKISDFGMSRMTEGDDDLYTVNTTAKTIPIKWTAPEALEHMTYTLATDVWAFGILLWEIFSGGKMPYAGMTNAQTRDEVIRKGYRMPCPNNCPEQVYELMLECWKYAEADRPTMSDIVDYFKDLRAFYPVSGGDDAAF